MSSDTFHVHVRAIEGDTIELRCLTGTAGGLNDFAMTRSFALIAMQSGMPRGAALERALAKLADASGHAPVWDESFHREHVAKFIVSIELLERSNIIDDIDAWNARYASGEGPRHEFVVRVRMTDPRFIDGLEVGDDWGTTAFDAWYPDPQGVSRERVAEVTARASHWP